MNLILFQFLEQTYLERSFFVIFSANENQFDFKKIIGSIAGSEVPLESIDPQFMGI